MFSLVDNYLIYGPEIVFLKSGNIYRITIDKEEGIPNSLPLSTFLSIKNSHEWKIFLRPAFSFSTGELMQMGVWRSEDKLDFIFPTANEVSKQFIYQNCYKNHADIFNLKQVSLALYKTNSL